MKFNPKEYQLIQSKHIHKYPRCAVWAGMGMGKTSGSLYALTSLDLISKQSALIVAPLQVALHTWPDEIEKWEDFHGLRVSTVCGGDQEARLEALSTKADIYTINYENLVWLIDVMKMYKIKSKWNMIILDEATRVKSTRLRQGCVRGKALKQIAFKADRFIELTGTPAPNGLIDLWGQLYFLDKGERLGLTFTSFKNRWFYYPTQYSRRPEPHVFADKQIHDRIDDICLSLRPEDWFDLTDPIERNIIATMPPAAEKQYKQMQRDLFTTVNFHEIDAKTAADKTIKCLQMASGALYTDNTRKKWVTVHDAKLDALESIIAESSGANILVAYQFKTDKERLKRRFKNMIFLIDDKNAISKWNSGKISLMGVHPQSAGHGLNMQYGGNILVFFSLWWNPEEREQVIERIGPVRQMQAGFNRPVFIYNIVAKNTLDLTVLRKHKLKCSVQDALMEAASRKVLL